MSKAECRAMKPLSIIPVALFAYGYKCLQFLKNHPYKQCVFISDTSFLKVPSCVSHSEFLVHNIPRMQFSRKKFINNVMVLDCTVVPCINQIRNESDVSETHSSTILPILIITLTTVTVCAKCHMSAKCGT
jgi:hypothetical protein